MREQTAAFLLVSIHAPGRGATQTQVWLKTLQEFQFTHPGGVRQPYLLDLFEIVGFQFTHPGGVRQYGAKLRIMGRINKRNLRLAVLL